MEEKINKIAVTLRQNGGRLTTQRKAFYTVLLSNPGSSPKELYFLAREQHPEIGRATVYRALRELEDWGFVQKQKIVPMF